MTAERIPDYYFVKESVFPFIKFPGVDPLLGPEMKSTGEVMGVGRSFGEAFYKSQLAAGAYIPLQGRILMSLRDADQQPVGIGEPVEVGLHGGRPPVVDQLAGDGCVSGQSDRLALVDAPIVRTC